jgi:hypothetical protein
MTPDSTGGVCGTCVATYVAAVASCTRTRRLKPLEEWTTTPDNTCVACGTCAAPAAAAAGWTATPDSTFFDNQLNIDHFHYDHFDQDYFDQKKNHLNHLNDHH